MLRGELPRAPRLIIAPAGEDTGNNTNGNKENFRVDRYECDLCGYVYDQKLGDPDNGVVPGTAWADVPADWVCPDCGAGKDSFTKLS